MNTLLALLDQHRNRGPFPTYCELQEVAVDLPPLQELLTAYQHGAPFPTYAQLAGLAFA